MAARLVPNRGPCDKRLVEKITSDLLRPLVLALRWPLDYALPPRCPGCGVITAEDHQFCVDCWVDLDFIAPPWCASCQMPLADTGGDDRAQCGACLIQTPPYDRVVALVRYAPLAARLTLRLKYGRRVGLARLFAALIAPRVGPVTPDALLIPVPLHRRRLWQRGYNQAGLMADALARRLGVPVDHDRLIRRHATQPTRGMNARQRAAAVKGAFLVAGSLAGRDILLVDDIFTTGATAGACAKALKRAGAASVTILCWARVIPDALARDQDSIDWDAVTAAGQDGTSAPPAPRPRPRLQSHRIDVAGAIGPH